MCTGSGCIAISLKLQLSEYVTECTGVDVSKAALEVAKENARRNEAKVTFKESNLFDDIFENYDIIVSNPPYIASKEVDELMPEVRLHEPRLALDGTEDGLFFYRKIVAEGTKHLKSGGALFFEIGYDQKEAVSTLLREAGYKEIKAIKDLAGKDRVVFGKK
jgi:release factor glutamine methyltransferase